MSWIWLVLLYGILKGCREICKKKALLTCSSIEVLLVYSFAAFLLVCPDAPHATGLSPKFYFFIALKSLVIFAAWLCSFKAIKYLPLSFYGVLDLSRVLFATLLGVLVLHEAMSAFNMVGLILVGTGLVMLRFQPIRKTASGNETGKTQITAQEKAQVSWKLVLFALASCMLNAISGLMDKLLMRQISSSQLQFWYMLFLCLFYAAYSLIARADINLKRALTNKWIWLLSIMFVIADRALFVANSMEASQITIMTLLKQAGCIVTILAGKFIFKEENAGYKLVCAGVIIAGIVLGVM